MLGEAAALHQLHGEVVEALVLADLVDGDDVGVPQVRGELGVREEAPHPRLVREPAALDRLQGEPSGSG